ncbi:2-aminoethanethiol (cysteamine) dioxygenase b [Thalassophryne amazonica]|uniref:2-aminoethanethiol (cysteamine) dioxygenase b n=1 Tax=Thalassophryne amazonica TaxID=390379 RepID=UPI00147268DD|nr:2-aminoethanethiol (cysteamine) dioxygenase b [Thalassophryne amazonica]
MLSADTNMNCIVQRVARQALLTFRNPPRVGQEASRSFLENHSELKNLVGQIRAADLRLVPRCAEDAPGAPPVTYMHICETERFSMGVFLLRSGACIPLHDHPGMFGILKVLYGTARISCFDPPAAAGRRCALRSTGEFTDSSGPCALTPERDNLHQIEAVGGPTAFMDILAPPYDPDNGRDCHYYKVLPGGTGADPTEVRLMEISQPAEFWCGGEPYPGPEVRL